MAVKKSYTLTPKAIWDKACKYDKIPTGSKFVVFSPKNPWAKEYDKSAHCGQFDGDNPSRHAYNAIMWFKSEILRRNK